MTLNAKRLNIVLLVVVLLITLALFGAVFAANQFLTSQSKSVQQALVDVKTLEQQEKDLRRAKDAIAKYQELADIAAGIVPQDKDQAETVRELTNLAAANGVSLSNITFPNSSLDSKSKADGQLVAVPGIPGTYTLSISISSDSGADILYTDFLKFLEALEQNRRTALVRTINVTPDPGNPKLVSFSLTLDEYIKP